MQVAPKTILIAGGSGLVGQRLTEILREKEYEVRILTRNNKLANQKGYYLWNTEVFSVQQEAFDGIDAIINLSGAGVADARWSNNRKREILTSRVSSNECLLELCKKFSCKPTVFCSASGTGYYGDKGNTWVNESNGNQTGNFLSDVCVQWEDSAMKLKEIAKNVSIVRTGIVLSKHDGMLHKMLPTHKAHIGVYIDSGKQYYPWIHIDDLCYIYLYCIENKLNGIFNAASPNPCTAKELSYAISRSLDTHCLHISVSSVFTKIAVGEMSSLLTMSTRVEPNNITKLGFAFKHPDIEPAIKDILLKKI